MLSWALPVLAYSTLRKPSFTEPLRKPLSLPPPPRLPPSFLSPPRPLPKPPRRRIPNSPFYRSTTSPSPRLSSSPRKKSSPSPPRITRGKRRSSPRPSGSVRTPLLTTTRPITPAPGTPSGPRATAARITRPNGLASCRRVALPSRRIPFTWPCPSTT
ncbi:MAG: hypothetical protein B9S32_11790 [Verrucomicrobia bacterium Tous-C9LFEB]|nr:MAG: hypothetical protein B9S32_11790 [Verrucomicrobia bacterium Tous-C9LFEB]